MGHIHGLCEEYGHTNAVMAQRREPQELKAPNTMPPQEYYKSSSFRGSLRNRSNIAIGDVRYEDWRTVAEMEHADLTGGDEGDEGPDQEEINRMYDTGQRRVPEWRVDLMLDAMRDKINQRTRGGAFLMQRALRFFDKDNSGGIDPEELRQGLLQFGLTFSDEEVNALMARVDPDRHGEVHYRDFMKVLLDT